MLSSRKSTRCARRRGNRPSLLGYLSVLHAFYAATVSLQPAREVSRAHKHDYWSQKVKEGHGTQACGTPLRTIFRFVGWKKFSPLKNTNLASSEKPHFLSPAKKCLFQSPAKARLFETKQSQTLKNKTEKMRERPMS